MAMRDGGLVGIDRVDWFNGGLFDDDTALSLEPADIALVREVAHLSWKDIDTSIFGTLFERGLDPSKGSQIGAHYTDQDKIEKIIDPVIRRPLLAEWEDVKSTMSSMIDMSARARRRRSRAGQDNLGVATYRAFLERLRNFKVLDPACGSGNFLYLALLGLKDIEHIVTIEAEAFGIARDERPRIGPEAVMGIERNLYAAELARMTVWIGEIQWMRRNGFDVPKDPILRPLDNIECRDAVLDIASGTEPQWPHADVIVGNPPYLGAKK
jgi:hypothetical protein